MRVPLRWLKELVDVDASTDEIAERLSLSGTSVEDVHRARPDGVSGIVAAKILEVTPIPEARNPMWVVQLDAGPQGRFQVVAGAPVEAGDVVPFAKPGARVATIPEPLSARKLVGHESQGMILAADELGLSEDHTAILRLTDGIAPGDDVLDALGLRDDVLELEITANRPDLFSIIGVARELAVLYDVSLRLPSYDVAEDGPDAAAFTSVEIEDRDGCPRYLARIVTDVAFGPSPAWVQARLAACDVRPLGNLVDATNYVLELTGQPLHAFDLDQLAEERIVVRSAQPGERLTTLDDVERKLEPQDLVIADGSRAQALAGIMGGAESEVGEETTRVLIESAYFEPRRIYRTARRMDLFTGASQRFEKGTDPAMVPHAAALCAELMRRWAGGTVATGAVDVGGILPRPQIRLRDDRRDAICGYPVDAGESDRILTGLGCALDRSDTDAAVVTPPTWRPDLTREIDLIEEVSRITGFDEIPMRVPTGVRGFLTKTQQLRRRLRDVLIGAGLSEATLPTFVPDEDLDRLSYGGPLVEVTNPMAADQRALRPNLVAGLLRAAQRNVARGRGNVRLFETGTVFVGWPSGQDLPTERERVAFVCCGDAQQEAWHAGERRVDAFDAKGIVEILLTELGIEEWSVAAFEGLPMHPGRSATVLVDSEPVGFFGEVRPSVAAAFDLPDAVAIAELDLGPLFARAPDVLVVTDVPHLPPVLRDIALVVDDEVPAARVAETITEAAKPHLESLLLLDVYRGEQIPSGRKSLAYRLTFRAPDRTLTAEEADAARENVVRAVTEGLGAEVR